MEPTVPSNFDERLNAVKIAAQANVLGRYGLRDLFRAHDIAPAAPGAWNKAKTFGKHVAEFGRDMVFGSPVTLAEQLKKQYAQTGSVGRTLGKQIKEHYLTPSSPTWLKAISVGMPALELGNIALRGDSQNTGRDLASAVTGLAVAPFTHRLGLPGTVLQGALQNAAGRVGAVVDRKRLGAPKPPLPQQVLPSSRT